MANDAKNELLEFIDKKAFDAILNAKADRFDDQERKKLEDVKKKTESEKKKFHECGSADEIKSNYLSNVHSEAAEKVNHNLKSLGLPTMPSLKDEFMDLCNKLGV